jgi:capsular exopolysaccharide synthesis family protein
VTPGDQHSDALASEPFPIEMPEQRRQAANAPRLVSQLTSEPAAATTKSEALLSEIPANRFDSNLAEKLVVDPRIPPGSREQYRRLAAVLHDAQAVSGLKVVMVASAVAGEGKTLTAVNLALTLSGSYRKRVIVIDADLRRPAMHQVFRIDAAQGLTDGLAPASEARLVVRQISPTLSVLPAGRPTPDPMAALISDRMRRLIDEARETFEWVIIDTPPLVLLPDANLLASMVDGAVLVIKAASTSHQLTKRAVEAIGRSRIVGVVLNRATESAIGRYGGYGDDYYQYYATAHPRSPSS